MTNDRIGCADLGRFIRYLYEYQNGQRVRNAGFVKVEEREQSPAVSIHGKGLNLTGKETLKLYIFYMDENVCRGIWQGDIVDVNPALNYRLIFTKEDTGRPENYDQIEGIILVMSGDRKLAATWNDMEVNVDAMKLWDEEPEQETEIILEEEMQMDTYITPSRPQFEKISRRDIARLPRCEWRLANNSFLVHGYHNFHHLILMEDEDGFWLGVPGIFHEKEERAAGAFGFPRFLPVEEEDCSLLEEMPKEEMFGYWCRKVRKGSE